MWQNYSGRIVLFLFFFQLLFAEGNGKDNKFKKTDEVVSYTHFTINNISSWFYANGDSDPDPRGNSGLIYPKGSGKACVFETGFVWGGIIEGYTAHDSIRVGGSTYRSSLKQGRIKEDGSAMDPADPRTRIYRVRPDYKSADLSDEIKLSGQSFENVLAQYELDWLQWPAEWGAPFEDINSNGVYEPEIDIPGVTGAHQTLWFVANDLDEEQSRYLYGSDPLGMEMQTTIWGYNFDGPLGNTIFRKYTLINKGHHKIKEMHLSLWSDGEIGGAGDDQIGCDTLLEMGYTYNGTNADPIYTNTPPAVGLTQIVGPEDKNNKKLGMTVFAPGFKNFPTMNDPDQGTYDGTIQMYNYLLGFTGYGVPWTVPHNNGWVVTKFPFAGEPKRTLDVNGVKGFPPGDRRMQICSGPIIMEPGDTQSVTYAQIVAGAEEGIDNFYAVEKLKENASVIRTIFNDKILWPDEKTIPGLTYVPRDTTIILQWGKNSYENIYTETTDFSGYRFYGYNIYQMPGNSDDLNDGILLAKIYFEDGKQFFYSAYGLELENIPASSNREILITRDYLSGKPFSNYNKYYYAVTSLFQHPDLPLNNYQMVESKCNIIEAMPEEYKVELDFPNNRNDLLNVTHFGPSMAGASARVVNPEELLNKKYKIEIAENGWLVYDLDEQEYLTDSPIPATDNQNRIFNSFYIKGTEVTLEGFIGTVPGLYKTQYSSSDLMDTPRVSDFRNTGIINSTAKNILGKGTGDIDKLDDDYQLIFTGKETEIAEGLYTIEEQTGSAATIIGAGIYSLSHHPLNPQPGSNNPFKIRVPFKILNKTTGQQVNLLIYDEKQVLGKNPFKSFSTNHSVICYILNTPYQNEVIDTSGSIMENLTWAFRFDKLGEAWKNKPVPDTLTLIYNNRLIPGEDEYFFSTTTPEFSNQKAIEQSEKINIFPNPLYGYNISNYGGFERYLTITHLPEKAKIIIFNLAGEYVTKIIKDGPENFVRWNLANDSNVLVGSGIYLIYISMPDLGKTKILKAAIIQTYY